MNELLECAVRAAALGIGATAVMDVWGVIAARVFGFPPMTFAMLGRWIGHMTRGTFAHASIARASPVPGEAVIGWAAHYATGIIFAALLLSLCGGSWTHHPTFPPAIAFGLATLAAPFLLMQPAMGAGIAASRTPDPRGARLRSLLNHAAFGVGLYAAARLLALF